MWYRYRSCCLWWIETNLLYNVFVHSLPAICFYDVNLLERCSEATTLGKWKWVRGRLYVIWYLDPFFPSVCARKVQGKKYMVGFAYFGSTTGVLKDWIHCFSKYPNCNIAVNNRFYPIKNKYHSIKHPGNIKTYGTSKECANPVDPFFSAPVEPWRVDLDTRQGYT